MLEAVNNFVGPAGEALNKIETRIRETKFSKEIKNKSEWVGTLLGVSRQHIDAEQWGQAVDKIEQIRTILSDLQQVFILNIISIEICLFTLFEGT